MPDAKIVEIGSHHRSQILMYARRRAVLRASGVVQSATAIAEQERRETLGLSGEFIVAAAIGQRLEFVEFDDGVGDGGVDLWNLGTSIDVKTEGARRPGAPFRAYPAKYRAKVIVFVRQAAEDRYANFQILGWLFAAEVHSMASGREYVDICLCHPRPIGSLPPDGHYSLPDPDLEQRCVECGREL